MFPILAAALLVTLIVAFVAYWLLLRKAKQLELNWRAAQKAQQATEATLQRVKSMLKPSEFHIRVPCTGIVASVYQAVAQIRSPGTLKITDLELVRADGQGSPRPIKLHTPLELTAGDVFNMSFNSVITSPVEG